jgi:hypothetical protein
LGGGVMANNVADWTCVVSIVLLLHGWFCVVNSPACAE